MIRQIRFGTAIKPLKVSSIAQIKSPWIVEETAISSTYTTLNTVVMVLR